MKLSHFIDKILIIITSSTIYLKKYYFTMNQHIIVHLLSISQNSPQMYVLRMYLTMYLYVFVIVFLFVVYLEKYKYILEYNEIILKLHWNNVKIWFKKLNFLLSNIFFFFFHFIFNIIFGNFNFAKEIQYNI